MRKNENLGCWVKKRDRSGPVTFVTDAELNPSHCRAGTCGHAELTGRVRAVLAATVADRWGQAVRVEENQKKVGFCFPGGSNQRRGAMRDGWVR